MTTLPQTTTARTPQVINPAVASVHVPGAPLGGGFQLTGADVCRILRTNFWLIVLLLILSGGAGYGVNYYLAKYYSRYTAVGLLEIQTSLMQDPVNDRVSDMPEPRILTEQRTQLQYLQSDSLFASLLKESVEVTKTNWYKSFLQPDPNGTGQRLNARKAKEYLADYFVARPVTDSKVMELRFSWSNPRDTKTIMEELVRIHVERQKLREAERTKTRTDMLKQMKETQDGKLRSLSERIRTRRSDLSAKGMGLPGEFKAKETELRALVENQMKSAGQASEAKHMFERVSAQIQRGDTPSEVEKAIENDPTVASLIREMISMEIQRDSKSETLGKGHREVEILNRLIEQTKQKMDNRRSELRQKYRQQYMDTLQGMMAQTMADYADIAKRIDDIKKDLSDLNKEVSVLLTEQEDEKSLREEKIKIENKLRDIGDILSLQNQSPIDWAPNGQPQEPETPSFPRLKYTMALAMLLGLALAIGIAFLRELLDETVRSPRDVSRVGQMNLLGMVVDEAEDPQAANSRMAIFDAPHSLTAEQFRQIRTRLQHASPLDTTRSIMITGTSPMDGKTTVALNLAAGLALNGRRVLLVDANFRRPELHRIFDIGNDRGFSNVLSGSASIEEIAQATRIPNLSVLPSGAKPANPTELFESQFFVDFIEQAMRNYDHVIFDSAPFLVVSESTAMAARVDGVVTVVRAHVESRGLLQRMRDSLRQIKARHIGVVLNAVRGRAGGYYRRNIKTYYDYQA